ncbi:J-domain-containing protein [Alkalihalobacillus sp. CinArs1]|uniref:DnaJ family domain-containing protein n=1 Tax=Alkalihalobacillus sp. CinArs1 TaxID=2995314 RepID=UPI0022DE5D76|nr:DUF1992 domain-containing protein [Alkalihalobacillus sp. CinArs1]
MDIAWLIAEDKIRTAIKNGEFNDLPGKGKRQKLEDLSSIPEELRIAYKILKNSGYLPEETQLKKELLTLEEILENCNDKEDRLHIKQKISAKQLKYDQLMTERLSKQAPEYEEKIRRRLT